jgi:hypothetical protein
MIRDGFVENVSVARRVGSVWKASVQTVPYPFDECPSEIKDMVAYATNIHDGTPGTRVVFAVPAFGPEEIDDGKPSNNKKQRKAINTARLCITALTGAKTYTTDGWIQPPTEEDLDNCSYIIVTKIQ